MKIDTMIDLLAKATQMAWEGEDIKHMYADIDMAKQGLMDCFPTRITDVLLLEHVASDCAIVAGGVLADYLLVVAAEVPYGLAEYADYASKDMLEDTYIFARKTLIELLDPRNDPIYPGDAYAIGDMLKQYPYAQFYICKEES